MQAEQAYTSTGAKYARHFGMIEALRSGQGRPQSLQVSPTNRCQIRCQFCSVDERDLKLEWELADLIEMIQIFRGLGIKTVEFSGGGDPTAYQYLPEVVAFCKGADLKLGMITNGLVLKNLPWETLSAFDWIRISMVTLDYVDKVVLPQPWPEQTTLGMSYVIGQINYTGQGRPKTNSDIEGLKKVREYAIRYGADFVRCVPECFLETDADMLQLHRDWEAIVADLGPPLFLQHKRQLPATVCYMDCVKPWAHSDGHIYPCNSISLNTEAHRDFDPKWRLCHWTEAKEYFETRGPGPLKKFDVRTLCDRCSFVKNNQEIERLMERIPHEEFV